MKTIVRFAPSTTGLLTVGDARMALINWLYAAANDGTFLLRLYDVVPDRSAAEFAIGIERDLLWLGLEWGEFARQSEREDRYGAAFETLKDSGRIYADPDSDDDADDQPPVWRFRLQQGEISWDELARNRQTFVAEGLEDPEIFGADGSFMRWFTSVIDDIDFAVTHVIRDDQRLAETSVQMQVFKALGASAPAFGHLRPMVVAEPANASAGELPTVKAVRDNGIEAMALNNMLVGLGREPVVRPRYRLADLANGFDLSDYGDAATFDPAVLRAFNLEVLHAMPFEAAEKRLADLGLEHADEEFWLMVRGHLDTFAQAVEWHRVCFADVPAIIEDLELVLVAREELPAEPFDATTWPTWVKRTSEKGAVGEEDVARVLRLAVTGAENGPGMDVLLPVIGRDRVLERLGG
ncbi:MAG: glutamate--tRNA ligase family protein [Rhodospirillales bacterium]|nr:glutamate--tRNA ligase family protein [Rhodospirillales bacterium]